MVKRNTPVTFVAAAPPELPYQGQGPDGTRSENPQKLMARSDIIVGVEVGTSKVCAVVGESGPRRCHSRPRSRPGHLPGRAQGEIVDLAIATECVHDAISDAETNSDAEIGSVFVGVTGSHILQLQQPRVRFRFPTDRFEIDDEDVHEVAVKAREVNIPTENHFLHSIIQRYYVDGQEGILNPVGMVGRKLDADFHIIHGVKTRLQNTLRCIREAGVEIDEIVVNSLASAQAVLNDHQKELGAIVIDMGGGVSDYIVYDNGIIRCSGLLAVGGDHISNDISLGLRIPLTRAEKLKVEEGSAKLGDATPGEMIVLKNDAGFSGKEVEREMLNTIIHARVRREFRVDQKTDRTGDAAAYARRGCHAHGRLQLAARRQGSGRVGLRPAGASRA